MILATTTLLMMSASLTLPALAKLPPLPQGGGERLLVQGPSPKVVRLGDRAQVVLRVDTQKNPPAPEVPAVDGLRMQLHNGGVEESTSYMNGRRSYRRSIKYVLVIKPLRKGEFVIPPFEVNLGTSKKKTPPFRLEAVKDLKGEQFAYLKVKPSAKTVYVHEPIRFTVDYGVERSVDLARQRVNQRVVPGVLLDAPWLDKIKGLEPIEPPKLEAGIVLGLNGQPVAVAYDPDTKRGRKTYHGFHLERSFLPTRTGRFELSAPVLSYVVRKSGLNRRFGIFEPEEVETFFVYGRPMQFEVKELPIEGRPQPYYNAVGRFRITAALNKRQVSVGESVKLILTIQGTGNLEFLEVPELKDLPGFHTLGKIEKRIADRVVVTYDLTPQTVSVKQIPAIHWNYFDTTPTIERYVMASTEPLPITVLPLKGQTSLAPLPNTGSKAVEIGVDDIYDMKPVVGLAPLALPAPPSRTLAWLAVLGPWVLFLLLATFLRKWQQRRADVAGQRSRGAARGFHRAVSEGIDSHEAMVGYLADRLACEPAAVIGPDLAERLQAAGVDADLAQHVQAQVDAGVAARYAGQNDGAVGEVAAIEALVRRLEAITIRPLQTAVLLLSMMLAAPALAQGGAQQPQGSAGEVAYRAGDYERAADLFAGQAEAGDRRAAYNLGNARYRQGRFADALVAWQRARLAMPRDPELLFNIKLVRQKLGVVDSESESFLATLAGLRDSLTPWERLWLCLLLNATAAGLVFLGGRRLRTLGMVVTVPAVLMILEVAWLQPQRPPQGIVVAAQARLRSEPKAELDPLMTLKAGVEVTVLTEGPAWTRVWVNDREGYLPNEAVSVVR